MNRNAKIAKKFLAQRDEERTLYLKHLGYKKPETLLNKFDFRSVALSATHRYYGHKRR